MKVQLFLPVSAGVHVFCCSFQLGGYDHWSAAFDFASLREGEGEGEGEVGVEFVDNQINLWRFSICKILLQNHSFLSFCKLLEKACYHL